MGSVFVKLLICSIRKEGLFKLKITPPKMAARKIKSKPKKTMGKRSKRVGKKRLPKVAKNLKLPTRKVRNPKPRKGEYQGASMQEFFLLQNKPQCIVWREIC